jgi:NitT/TauT family transport system permease protein
MTYDQIGATRPAAVTAKPAGLSPSWHIPKVWWPLLIGTLVLVIWQALAVVTSVITGSSIDNRLPRPWTIATTFVGQPSLFLDALVITWKGAVIGLLVGIVIGVVVALLSVASRVVESVIYPYIVASQMVPTIILAPIILAVVQNGEIARVLAAAYITFFVIALNLTKGLRSVAPDELTLLRSIYARPWQIYTKVRVPRSLPHFFVGLKVAAPLSVVGEVTIELTGAQSGLGTLTLTSLKYGESHVYTFWVAVLLIGSLGYAMFLVASLLERWLTPWQPEFRGTG